MTAKGQHACVPMLLNGAAMLSASSKSQLSACSSGKLLTICHCCRQCKQQQQLGNHRRSWGLGPGHSPLGLPASRGRLPGAAEPHRPRSGPGSSGIPHRTQWLWACGVVQSRQQLPSRCQRVVWKRAPASVTQCTACWCASACSSLSSKPRLHAPISGLWNITMSLNITE